MKKLIAHIILVVMVIGFCGCEAPESQGVHIRENIAHTYEIIRITGETAPNGIYDPSLEYDPTGTGWMAYSSVEAPKYVHTHLAKTTDHGKTWEYVSTINNAVDGTITTDKGIIEGVWRHEVPTLVHDQKDPGREWKLFWHKYFTSPPYEAGDRMFQYGWIAYKYAPEPEGPWSQEIPLFGAGMFPLGPFETLMDLNDLHKDLREFICYSEPGSLVKDDVLYLSLNGHVIKGGTNIGKVFLLASYDHGDTWEYINTLLEPEDAQYFDALFFSGSSLAEENNRVFLLVTPESPADNMMGHNGTCIFEFEDIKKGKLKREENKLLVHKYFSPTVMSGGQSDYDEQNTYGGVVMPQVDTSAFPDVFQLYNTKEKIVS